MKRFARAQFAMEYLLVIGFSVLLLIPLVSIIYTEYSGIQEDISMFEVNEAIEEINFQAERLYAAGLNSKNTVTIRFPNGIDNITFEQKDITVHFTGEKPPGEYFANQPMQGEIRNIGGPTRIVFEIIQENQVEIVNITTQ